MLNFLKNLKNAFPAGALMCCAAIPGLAVVGVPGCLHTTNGAFDASEWNCASVIKSTFSPPGAALYVDQGVGQNNNLYLMYDFFGGGSTPSSFFDVFFEVVPDNTAYLVRIPAVGTLSAFERQIGSIAPQLPNGSFDIGAGSGWDPLDAHDLDLARFKGAVGLGASPDDPSPHPMAEFQLTINRGPAPGPAGGPGGIYDPAPAFWGASEKSSGGADPPISSGIFQLNPDGSTIVLPLLGPDDLPLMQSTATPEPATFLIFGTGTLALLGLRRRSRI